jgi:hypothetical protein
VMEVPISIEAWKLVLAERGANARKGETTCVKFVKSYRRM